MTIRAVTWQDSPVPGVRLLDQTALPAVESYLIADTVDLLVDAIQRLVVRGAPALGAVGALGVVVALVQAERESWDETELSAQIRRLREARPTAVNLAWGVDQVSGKLPDGVPAVLAAAQRVMTDDESANRRLSLLGADWLLPRTAHRPVRVLTHCNAGSLATVAWGTALGVVRELHARTVLGMVYVGETRPLFQGTRLTAWELSRDGIDYVVQADGAAASTISRRLVDVAVVGADRIAANGDTANKIGTLGIALACADAGIPIIVAAPWSTVDLNTPDGDGIHIEERPQHEVLSPNGQRVAPPLARAFNPAFDVTLARLIDAIATERGVIEPKSSGDRAALRSLAGVTSIERPRSCGDE